MTTNLVLRYTLLKSHVQAVMHAAYCTLSGRIKVYCIFDTVPIINITISAHIVPVMWVMGQIQYSHAKIITVMKGILPNQYHSDSSIIIFSYGTCVMCSSIMCMHTCTFNNQFLFILGTISTSLSFNYIQYHQISIMLHVG